MRGIAVILVLFSHFRYSFPINILKSDDTLNLILSFFDFGGKGVQLFYILSAFTLFNSYYYRKQNGNSNVVSFYIRRFFRIAPLFYICLLAMILNNHYQIFQNEIFFQKRLELDQINYNITNVKQWYLSTFLFINGFFPKYIQSPYPGGWSIAVEFTFYMLIPILVNYITSFKKSLFFLIICFAISFAIESIVIIFKLNGTIGDYFILSILHQLYFFSIGILFFFIKNDIFKFNRMSLIIGFIIIIFSILLRSPYLISGLIFFIILFYNSKIGFLKYNLIQYIGKISFSLYLVQWWAIILISKLLISYKFNYFLLFIIYIFFSIILASFTYLVEKYFIKKGEILISKL